MMNTTLTKIPTQNRMHILSRTLAACFLLVVVAGATHTALSMRLRQTNDRTKGRLDSNDRSGTPVLVELFTSEGCSSCPSADSVLADLKREQPLAGVRVIALGEHVDYWNYIGWHDPFSSPAYTARQVGYGKALHLNGVYTPQAIVDGKAELVGSERESLGNAIRSAARTPKAVVVVTSEAGAAGNTVHIDISKLPTVRQGETADVMLAITQDNLSSAVTRGENAGHTLPHAAVVRVLRKIGTVSEPGRFRSTTALNLQSDWKRSDLQAVVFVQEHNSGHILGVNALPLAAN